MQDGGMDSGVGTCWSGGNAEGCQSAVLRVVHEMLKECDAELETAASIAW